MVWCWENGGSSRSNRDKISTSLLCLLVLSLSPDLFKKHVQTEIGLEIYISMAFIWTLRLWWFDLMYLQYRYRYGVLLMAEWSTFHCCVNNFWPCCAKVDSHILYSFSVSISSTESFNNVLGWIVSMAFIPTIRCFAQYVQDVQYKYSILKIEIYSLISF